MTRSRASAKQAGADFETLIAKHLATALNDDRIERRTRNGANDRGDIGGVRAWGKRVVVEAKEHGGRFLVGPWLNEAERERGNDDAAVCFVVAKRKGTRNPGDQVVFMTMRDLVVLLGGERVE